MLCDFMRRWIKQASWLFELYSSHITAKKQSLLQVLLVINKVCQPISELHILHVSDCPKDFMSGMLTVQEMTDRQISVLKKELQVTNRQSWQTSSADHWKSSDQSAVYQRLPTPTLYSSINPITQQFDRLSIVVLHPTQHKIGNFRDVSAMSISWFNMKKIKPHRTKVRIYQSKQMYYNTK